ncbi:TldD/PmbA family protein [Nocardioides aurantiacus]|uniref:TldD protein n=1 Tax=Nocardioides aurantiacus TaxID=86796 RepID=A0A3N2CTE2_9ACTN|nr:TldD/PmbA family protein [Nocardioides aurantiacus]ROR90785.1 TldD protein [Nocardioides aurantiacus]
MADVDPSFLALPLQRLAQVALGRARDFGVTHADFRLERNRLQHLSVRDGQLEGAQDSEDLGFAVRVLLDGAWGFASGVGLTDDEAVRVAETAVTVARVAAKMTTVPVQLAPEPVHRDVTWVSAYDVNPLDVPLADKVALLGGWTRELVAGGADHAAGMLQQVQENKFYADLAGSSITQQRVWLEPVLEAYASDPATGAFDSMASTCPPFGAGWEALTDGSWDFDTERAELPGLLRAKLAAPSVEPGRYDLVIDANNLMLTIHESVGHATELDRALGYEASYAGTSFATPDHLGTLQYGSPAMHVTGDRTARRGLATVGFDDEGVEGQSWDIVRDGVLVGYQLDRSMAHTYGAALNGGRSNGCAYADSPGHVPIQRMANVSLQPDPDGPDTAGLIGRVERGIHVVGHKSWSIDMQRYNFQFTGQRFYAIEDGELKGQLRDVAYQATTTDFWGSLEAVGGPQTYVLGGVLNCGKAQPGQSAPVSHGTPSALFRDVNVLNTSEEGTA